MSDTPETDAERELIELKETAERYRLDANAMMMQRDQLLDVAEKLIAMIRVNYMHGMFSDCSIEKIDHHLRPWINKIETIKGTKI